MHELGASSANQMLCEVTEDAGNPVSQKTLPSGDFPICALHQEAERPDRKADNDQRLAIAQPISDRTEIGQPRIGQLVGLHNLESSDKSGERNIPLEQSDECEDECDTGTGEGEEANEK